MNGSGSGGVSLAVSPDEPLLDEVIGVRVTGLDPGDRATLRVEMEWEEVALSSRTTFEADADGVVDPAEAAPVGGSYEGTHPMGPFLALAPDGRRRPPRDPPARLPTTVAVERDGETVATARFDRVVRPEGVERREVEAAGVPADLYVPAGEGPHPGVVLLGGSEGGRPRGPHAPLLAAHGYAVLGPAYFGVEGAPSETLVEVPVGAVEAAVDWFAGREAVRGEPLATVGFSRGSELGFLLASRLDAVRTAVGYVPSGVAFEGLDGPFQPAGTAAWAVDGDPVEYVPLDVSLRDLLGMAWGLVSGRPVEFAGAYVGGVESGDDGRVADAAIPVGETGGPVLLVGAGDDRMWRSAELARRLHRRLDGDVRLRTYSDAGHFLSVPYLPTANRETARLGRLRFAQGGTPAGYAEADEDAWEAVLETLADGIGEGRRRE